LTMLQSLPEWRGLSSCPKCKICSTKKYIAPLSHGRSHHIRPFMVRLFRMYVVSLT
jgi:hypothetical protein